jgi:hypothetical protein
MRRKGALSGGLVQPSRGDALCGAGAHFENVIFIAPALNIA